MYNFIFAFQDGFAQPDTENVNGDLDLTNGNVMDNGNGSNFVGGEDETY